MIVLVTACLVNNLQRQYPKFWVAEIPPPPPTERKIDQQHDSKDAVREDSSADSSHTGPHDLERASPQPT